MFKPLCLLLSASQERQRIKRNERNVAEKRGEEGEGRRKKGEEEEEY